MVIGVRRLSVVGCRLFEAPAIFGSRQLITDNRQLPTHHPSTGAGTTGRSGRVEEHSDDVSEQAVSHRRSPDRPAPRPRPDGQVTDMYYRSLVKELGGAGLVVSEFISAEGLTRDNVRTKQMLAFNENERPVAIQIYGGDPDRMDDAAAIVEAEGVDIVDVNMGCPVRKVVNSGAGSALLKDFDRAAEVVEKIRKRVKIPLTVKVRKGWESDDVLPLLKRFEEIGVAAIAIHGRTRNEAYTGASDWSYIAHVKRELRIPVWGNGDVKAPSDARRMLEQTGVDGVMIGRAALHNPFIFRDIVAGGT